MNERNPSIELLRCILMFGICLLHTIGKGPWYIEYTSLSLWLMTCVSGFVFISGYYGIQFSISKAFRLYGVSIGAGLSVLLFGKYYYNLEYTLKDIFQIIWGQWYLNAYFF